MVEVFAFLLIILLEGRLLFAYFVGILLKLNTLAGVEGKIFIRGANFERQIRGKLYYLSSVYVFFGNPRQFKGHLPLLGYCLCILLPFSCPAQCLY